MTDVTDTVHTIKVPDAGEGIAEVELVSWAVDIGQTVTRNQVVAEVMTDKATIEVPAPMDGVVAGRTGQVGEILLVGADLFTLAPAGTDPGDLPAPSSTGAPTATPTAAAAATSAPTPAPAPDGATGPTPEVAPAVPAPSPNAAPAEPTEPGSTRPASPGRPSADGGPAAPRQEGRRPTATPAVRRRAREAGIDLRRVAGTGPAGRITHDDLDAVFNGAAPTAPPAPVREGAVRDEPIVGLRRRIAERMVTATTTIPHITYVEEVDVTELERLRATLNQRRDPEQPKLTILPFLIRAIINEVANHPIMNTHVLDADPATAGGQTATLRSFDAVHVGIATQTDTGLIVPVLRNAQALDLWAAAAGIADLAEATRSGRATAADLSGSTITITSLGALGGIVTTPVINKPEVAIVGVNKIVTRPVWVDGQFVPRQIMNLSSSFDHRVVDGWDAARFIQGLRAALEQPALLFLDDGAGR